ncbi:MAG: GxxExxY protein [Proteobacteria bacterium]|nr:GxxExxY protein [Pseudomonadota bacterium]
MRCSSLAARRTTKPAPRPVSSCWNSRSRRRWARGPAIRRPGASERGRPDRGPSAAGRDDRSSRNVDVKAADPLLPLHAAQLLTYSRLSLCRLELLPNFNTVMLKDGIRRRAV